VCHPGQYSAFELLVLALLASFSSLAVWVGRTPCKTIPHLALHPKPDGNSANASQRCNQGYHTTAALPLFPHFCRLCKITVLEQSGAELHWGLFEMPLASEMEMQVRLGPFSVVVLSSASRTNPLLAKRPKEASSNRGE